MWTEPEQIFYGCSVVYYCSLLWNVSQVERITKINYSWFWNESCTSQLYSGWNSNYSGLFISYNHLFSLYTWVVILEWVLPLLIFQHRVWRAGIFSSLVYCFIMMFMSCRSRDLSCILFKRYTHVLPDTWQLLHLKWQIEPLLHCSYFVSWSTLKRPSKRPGNRLCKCFRSKLED